MFEGFPGVFYGKQRLGLFVPGELFTKGVLGVFFLQVTGIRQQHPAQLVGGGGAVDLTPEPVFDQRRQVAGVVDVGVGKHNRIDAGRINRKARPVTTAQGFDALVHAAVYQQTVMIIRKQVARAGNRTGAAEEAKFHWQSVLIVWGVPPLYSCLWGAKYGVCLSMPVINLRRLPSG